MRQARIKAVVFVVVALGAFALTTSCKNSSNDLPVKTVDFAPDGSGFIQYYTNDTAKLSQGWYQYYTSTATALSTAPWDISVTIRKNSGAIGAPAGCIYGFTDTNDFYRFLASWNGQYRLDKKVAGTYSTVVDWTSSTAINTGLGATNVVEIQYTAGGLNNILINGTLVYGASDVSASLTSGSAGFYAVVDSSTYEEFPNTPVDVRFKMTSPVAIP